MLISEDVTTKDSISFNSAIYEVRFLFGFVSPPLALIPGATL